MERNGHKTVLDVVSAVCVVRTKAHSMILSSQSCCMKMVLRAVHWSLVAREPLAFSLYEQMQFLNTSIMGHVAEGAVSG